MLRYRRLGEFCTEVWRSAWDALQEEWNMPCASLFNQLTTQNNDVSGRLCEMMLEGA